MYEFTGQIDTPFQLNTGTSYFLGITDSTPNEFAYVLHTGGSATCVFQYVVPAGACQSGTGSFAFKSAPLPSPPLGCSFWEPCHFWPLLMLAEAA